jgi:hypothetical protein
MEAVPVVSGSVFTLTGPTHRLEKIEARVEARNPSPTMSEVRAANHARVSSASSENKTGREFLSLLFKRCSTAFLKGRPASASTVRGDPGLGTRGTARREVAQWY